MEELLAGLNRAQRSAVTSEANVVQVLAPPGSGKTKTLTARVSYLITQRGFKPWNIIVCTFTVKAAREMKERIKTLVGNGLEKKLILGTFHGISRRFLVQYGYLIGLDKNFGIADSSDSKAIIKKIIKDNGLSIEPGKAAARISSNKAKSISAEQYAANAKKKEDEQEFMMVYSQYEAALSISNLLDYDDLLLRCADLLRDYPQCVANIQAVLIDEFQDTNEVQYNLMGLFAQHQRTVTIVGDPDQSIYGWRNAEIKNLERMKKQYQDTLVIFLEENYRSSGAILGSAQMVIEQDTTRPDKKLQATHTFGEQPVLRKLPTAEAEARWLYSDFAVLLRSAQLSRHIEGALGNAGIPYRMVGGTKFYDRVEVKVIIDYLRVINQPEHSNALLRVLNVPSRQIGEVTVKGLLDEAQQKQVPLWNLLLNTAQGRSRPKTKLSAQAEKGITDFVNIVLTSRKKMTGTGEDATSPSDLVDHLLKRLDFEKFLKRKYPEDSDARWANIEELKAQTADLSAAITRGDDILEEEVLPQVEGVEQKGLSQTEDVLSVFLANIALSSEVEKKNEENAEPSQYVTISTIHAAKGLEWPVVFIPACYEGSIPHSRAEDHDEERRLLYVGMTRAQAILYLSCPTKNSNSQDTTMSPFLALHGADAHFTCRGPLLEYYAVAQLAQTLRRECPEESVILEGMSTLDLWEDTYWPDDGTMPLEEEARWDRGKNAVYGSALTIKRQQAREGADNPSAYGGFVSAASVPRREVESLSVQSTIARSGNTAAARMAELEQTHEDVAMQELDKRLQSAKTSSTGNKKGAKVAVGANSIASYFGRPAGASQSAVSKPAPIPVKAHQPMRRYNSEQSALHDITNSAASHSSTADLPSFSRPAMTLHKPRTTPSFTRANSSSLSKRDDYVILSSSPPPESEAKRTRLSIGEDKVLSTPVTGTTSTTMSGFTSASTFHTTTVSQIGSSTGTGRKTLGVGRRFVPWSARGGKR
ncbi:hypothetical protein MBLNU457_4617t1 [Dothideomycetes sp. NU457]